MLAYSTVFHRRLQLAFFQGKDWLFYIMAIYTRCFTKCRIFPSVCQAAQSCAKEMESSLEAVQKYYPKPYAIDACLTGWKLLLVGATAFGVCGKRVVSTGEGTAQVRLVRLRPQPRHSSTVSVADKAAQTRRIWQPDTHKLATNITVAALSAPCNVFRPAVLVRRRLSSSLGSVWRCG